MPYKSTTEKLTDEQVKGDRTYDGKDSPLGQYKDINMIWDLSYPQQSSGGRSKTPDWFAGWNYTMIESTCSLPIKPFSWEFSKSSSSAGYPVFTITDTGDIPEGVELSRVHPVSDLIFTHFDAHCVARWCDACVEHAALDHGDGLSVADEETKLTVSIMNKKLLAETSLKGESLCMCLSCLRCGSSTCVSTDTYLWCVTVFQRWRYPYALLSESAIRFLASSYVH